MKRLLARLNKLPLGWQIAVGPIIAPAIIFWAFPVLHALPVVIAIAFLTMSASGYIEWGPWPQFLFYVSLPYVILIVGTLLSIFSCIPLVLTNPKYRK